MNAILEAIGLSDRQGQRREHRKKIAECELARRRVEELGDELIRLDNRADEAADRHRQQTEKPQRELADIEERVMAAMADRVAVDPALEQRRVELLRVIEDANNELALSIAGLDKVRKPLEKARSDARSQTTEWQMLKNKLGQAPLADPELMVEQFVAQQRLAAMQNWERNSRLLFERIESELAAAKRRQARGVKEDELLGQLEARFARWNATVLVAAQESHDAQIECNELHQKMVDE